MTGSDASTGWESGDSSATDQPPNVWWSPSLAATGRIGLIVESDREALVPEPRPEGPLPADAVQLIPADKMEANILDANDEMGEALVAVDHPKMVREALCAAQSALWWSAARGHNVEVTPGRVARLQTLINEIDKHRPLGPDGKHGDRHTATCGCERLRARAALTEAVEHAGGHHYLATSCHHDLHGRCRRTCKFCQAACECGCHRPTEVSQ